MKDSGLFWKMFPSAHDPSLTEHELTRAVRQYQESTSKESSILFKSPSFGSHRHVKVLVLLSFYTKMKKKRDLQVFGGYYESEVERFTVRCIGRRNIILAGAHTTVVLKLRLSDDSKTAKIVLDT
jgi:hypothetical protein